MGIVICKLPKAGLGNQLFPLMKAYTFAHLNQLPLTVTNYRQLKPGPWLRGEKNKRNYKGFFTFQKKFLSSKMDEVRLIRYKSLPRVAEPIVQKIEDENTGDACYFFSAIPHYTRYFDGLKENRKLVIQLLYNIIAPSIIKKAGLLSQPFIGVHIRMGDFRKLREGEEIGKVGTVRTPEEYYVNIINLIRDIHGSDVPVSVFTDGLKSEFETLFKLKKVQLMEGNNDLVDLLLLSRSKIIVTSAGSTFSYWAAFLSDAPVLMHPAYVNISIRPAEVNKELYYGAITENNNLLISKIKAIQYDTEKQH